MSHIASLWRDCAFTLAIAEMFAVDAATIRGKIANAAKALQRAGLEPNGHRQNVTDARHGFEQGKFRYWFEALRHHLFDLLDLRL